MVPGFAYKFKMIYVSGTFELQQPIVGKTYWYTNILKTENLELGLWCLTPLSTIIQLYIVAVSFIGGGYRSPRDNYWQTCAGFELTTLVVIGTDCIGCKSNYHMITTMRTNDIIKEFKFGYFPLTSYPPGNPTGHNWYDNFLSAF